MKDKILVIGVGFLGQILVDQLKENDISVVGTTSKNFNGNRFFLDITDLDTIEKSIRSFKPNIIVNCAATTNIDYLESHSEIAFSINSFGPKNLAMVCKKYNIKLIHISTDSVFDGKDSLYSEKNVPNPINIYNKSKVLGEQIIIENLSNYIIIRTNFFGINNNGKFILNSILKTLSEKKVFVGFDDVFWNPLEITNLTQMIIELINIKFTGIINLSSNEIISKYQFALYVAKAFNLDSKLVHRGSRNYLSMTPRPNNTSLSNTKAKNLLRTKIIPVDISLKKLMQKSSN